MSFPPAEVDIPRESFHHTLLVLEVLVKWIHFFFFVPKGPASGVYCRKKDGTCNYFSIMLITLGKETSFD